ncbi:NAD(P)-dependent dehydrogenase, short-chain alcohol dehydrogenase family [Nocardioides sp. YR527]|uniref:SDR family NAD(P)-dependent oxidoreductase n=1 Tax=Nocardioides sp. YR527 TaxID=1881028 RepID=UPI00088A7DFD|nr:SDR family oxidoreductase [Nocardioides sp. YR527]SDK66694.1 NAD(P)-dependent dehydrogenase, short-chain alcohol dehydrogenase family [Nocardioides sp. YR527]
MSRVVLVTGGGTGIGAAVARLLARGGDRVVICGRREAPLRAVAEETGAQVIVADVSKPEGIARVVDGTIATYGRLDGLVVNHGIIHVGRVDEVTPEQWDETLRVNLTSPFLLVREALPHLLAARGALVAVSSVAALRASDGMAAYSASKAGLLLLTQSLAVDHGRDGLRANAVCPGWTETEMGDMEMAELGAARGVSADEAYRLATAIVPQRRAAHPDEVAATVGWLLSDAASYVNGVVLPVDGGSSVVDPGTIALDPRVSIDLNQEP